MFLNTVIHYWTRGEWEPTEVVYERPIKFENIKYTMIGYDTQRPGHDFRYALSGEYMKQLGWEPKYSFNTRIEQMVTWTLKNDRWLKI